MEQLEIDVDGREVEAWRKLDRLARLGWSVTRHPNPAFGGGVMLEINGSMERQLRMKGDTVPDVVDELLLELRRRYGVIV